MPSRSQPIVDCVKPWVAREAAGLSPAQCLQLFELAFRHVWGEARKTISGLTLQAVMGRALFDAAEAHPFMNAVEVGEDGPVLRELGKIKGSVDRGELLDGLEHALTGFLSILGSITNEVITAQLCAGLTGFRFVPNMKVVKGQTGEEG